MPNDLDKAAARTVIDALKNFFMHRANEYYAVLPYIHYTLSSYNPKTGLYFEPPSKPSNFCDVPTTFKHIYKTQSELLYREVLTCIKQSGMATITQQFLCGRHQDVPASTSVDDGVMACYCLLAKYAKVDSRHLDELEQKFVTAPQHFTTGSPAHKIKHLRPYLIDVLDMGLTLKSSQTIIPIVDILSQRHNKFAVELSKYADGGETHLFLGVKSPTSKDKSGTGVVNAFKIYYTLFKNTTLKDEKSGTRSVRKFRFDLISILELEIAMSTFSEHYLYEPYLAAHYLPARLF